MSNKMKEAVFLPRERTAYISRYADDLAPLNARESVRRKENFHR